MKKIILSLLIITSATAFAKKSASCQKVAEKAALSAMDDMNSEGLTDDDGNPRGLSPEERASSTDRTVFLDSDENEVSEETGIYGVEMSVMEECMDGLKVTAKLVKKKNKSTCEVISIKPWGNRDCG